MKSKLIFLLLLIVFFVSCDKPTPRKPVVRKSSTFLKESIERNKVINKLEEEALLQLMASDSSHHYLSSANGFWYYYISKDSISSKSTGTGDEVFYSYEIKDINSKVLYTMDELGERSYLIDKQELITGLQDGLKLMKEGEIVTFLFPSHKAYGYSGYKKIGSNQPLIYTVTVNKIVFNN
jgi:gliding motility-associated peptidyl-prolyl isomerase